MTELIYYLEANGIQYEAITRSKLFLLGVTVLSLVFASAIVAAIIAADRHDTGHVTKHGVVSIVLVLALTLGLLIDFYAEQNIHPEKIIIHCTDEQFAELYKMGFKVKLGENPGEWIYRGR